VMRIWRWLGIELDETSMREKVISALGGAVSILCVLGISHRLVGGSGASLLVASMGASAVLLFAVPHGQLSQPWPVFGGHVVSAVIGVTSAKVIPNRDLAAACAVGVAIAAMHQFKFIHPPGGATALTAVVGGPAVTGLGYSFVWRPVLLNTVTIIAVAVAFNWWFPWRRYPARATRRDRPSGVSHADIVAALRELDSFIDVTQDDLVRLIEMLPRRPAESD
jgi:CBS domain-containing membrane protein